MCPHVIVTGKFNPLQSAYRKHHSTETALIKILEDLYRVADGQSAAVLIGLDLLAAFDTIDHKILIRLLQAMFGILGMALRWIDSYLWERKQYKNVGSEQSKTTPCDVCVPQGSVLGPFLAPFTYHRPRMLYRHTE